MDLPSEELLREGFGLTIPAGALRGTRFVPDYDEDGGRYIPGTLGYDRDENGDVYEVESLWKVPTEGIMLPRPNAFQNDLTTNPAYAGDWISLAGLDHHPDDFDEVVVTEEASRRWIVTKRENDAAEITGIAAPPREANLRIGDRGLVWAAHSSAILKVNEGVSVFGTPFGAGIDKGEALFGLLLGARFYVEVGIDGWADLWQDVSKPSNPATWLRRRRFETGLGGFSDGASVQVTVVPWGIDAVTIVWSTAAGAGQESTGAGGDGALTFHGHRSDWYFPWDAALNHYRKTEAAPVYLALPKKRQSQIGLLRLRYKTAYFAAGEVPLGGPKPDQNVRVATIGYRPSGSTTPLLFEGPRGPYVEATDDRIVPYGSLAPSDPAHPPEMWAIEVLADPISYTANTTPLDFSHLWRRLEGRSTVGMEATRLEMLLDRSGDVQRLLRVYGTVQLKVDGEIVFGGRVETSRPVFDGALGELVEGDEVEEGSRKSYGIVTDDMCAVDRWGDLETAPASHSTSFAKRTIGVILQDAFKRGGIPPALYSIAPELFELEVDGWDRADDFKAPHEDTCWADVIRVLSFRYGTQGYAGCRRLRVLRVNGVFVCTLSKDWRAGDDPDAFLWFHPETLPEDLVEATEEERWAEDIPWVKALNEPNWDIAYPECDAMRAWAVSGAGEGADALGAYIAADPRRSRPMLSSRRIRDKRYP
ncbi:hypothetical protein EON81_13675, partial [bacterium]